MLIAFVPIVYNGSRVHRRGTNLKQEKHIINFYTSDENNEFDIRREKAQAWNDKEKFILDYFDR